MANKQSKKPSGKIKKKYGVELGKELQRYFDNPPYIPPGKTLGFRWTPQIFGNAVNVSDSMVRAWLRGDSLPSNNISGVISAIFGRKPEEFASEIAAFLDLLRRCERERDGKCDENTAPIVIETDNRSKRLDGQLGPDTYVQATSIYRSPDTSLEFPLIFAPRLPPALYAEPAYIASHVFVGRQEQLAVLSAWAEPNDPDSMLLLRAMGGAGKSFLAWHWVNYGAVEFKTNWAGRFWYSFYEPHASVRDFHCHLLSYMSGQPIDTFRRIDDVLLLATTMDQLRRAPWLVVLDGLERLLVHYHRMDAHYVDDALAGTEDRVGARDPCAVIRSQDASFLRGLSSVAPSKILVTTRLVPDCLLSSGHQSLPGVKIHDLAGLNLGDAYLMMRDNGVFGDAATIGGYLKVNFDCHPLVIGVLTGIINTYLPARGDFDAWVNAPEGGRSLNLGEVSLVQRHNDILNHAIRRLSPDCNRVLSTIAPLSRATDYATIAAMVTPAFSVAKQSSLDTSGDNGMHSNLSHSDGNQAPYKRLQQAITSLQKLGLLQYDGASDR